MIFFLMLLAMADPAFALNLSGSSLKATAVALPGGSGGVGFDDIVFSAQLHKLIVPAGHTGKLYLIDPTTHEMISIGGFSSSTQFKKGQHTGISSADEGDGFIFTADHGNNTLDAVDVNTGTIAALALLADAPDIIRYVGSNHEVWVTEPDGDNKQIEVFSFRTGLTPALSHAMSITVADGPESLTIDNTHQRAYTNLGPQTAAIDLKSHAVIAQWPNTCEKSRGTAVDEERNFLFVACGEGKAVVFDLNQSGKLLSSLTTGAGPDLVDYNPRLSHFYITGSKSATVSVLGVSSNGQLSLLSTSHAVERAHCVTADDQDNIWVCDPHHGQLLLYKDTLSKSN